MINNNLKNKTILVTRPAHQAKPLADLIHQFGGETILFPTIEIKPVQSISFLPFYNPKDPIDYAIFISANAVEYGIPVLNTIRYQEDLKLICVGQGSQQALNQLLKSNIRYQHFLNYDQLIPSLHHYDTQGILDIPHLQSEYIANKKMMIFKGIGGKKALAEALKLRQAQVYTCSCYERINPQINDFELQSAVSLISAIVISSAEGFQHLWCVLSDNLKDQFKKIPFVVIHKNIYDKVKAEGIETCLISETSDEGIISTLLNYSF